MLFYPTKFYNQVYSVYPPLAIDGVAIDDVAVHELLGLTLSSSLSWRGHILKIHKKNTCRKFNQLKCLSY